MAGIPLAEAIQELRAELTRATKQGADETIRFVPGPIELELGIEVSLTGETSGKVKFWVVEIDAEGELARVATHKLKLSLRPVDAAGHDITVNDSVPRRPGG